MPDITRKTVYNTLRELIELNHLCPVLDPSKHGLRYDTTTDLHHHLVCLRCHALLDIHHDFAGVALAQDDTAGYRIIRHQVTFYGYCPACRINEDKQAN
jgi:Fur family ferric uptake transcriptional regulator